MIYQEKIKILCKRRKITLKTLAESIGMSEAGFHRSLKDNNLQVRKLLDIANYFEMPLNFFLEESSNELKEPEANYSAQKKYLEERVSVLECKVDELAKHINKDN